MADLGSQIDSTAAGPASAKGDAGEVAAQPLPDLIQADQYRQAAAAVAGVNSRGGVKSGWGCLRIAKGIPPGARGSSPEEC